jgi:hypothetical protein
MTFRLSGYTPLDTVLARLASKLFSTAPKQGVFQLTRGVFFLREQNTPRVYFFTLPASPDIDIMSETQSL